MCTTFKILLLVCLPALLFGQGFIPTGDMKLARAGHTATLLRDGKVLITGGHTPGGISNTAEIYDPATGTWRFTQFSMNQARAEHRAVLLQNGKVLIVGGGDALGSLKSVEIYDPATETFTLTGSMANERHGFEAVRLNDGRVLAVSGRSTVTFTATPTNEVYSPATGTWSAAPNLAAGATNHTAVLLPSGQVLIAGGYDGFTPTAYNFVYLYTPATNTLVAMSPLLTPRLDHGATLLSDGKVLIAAGSDPSFTISSTEVYDPTAAPNGQSLPGSSLNQHRRHFTTTLLGNGNVLVIGGFQGSHGLGTTPWLATAELRNAGTGQWTPAGMMSTPRSGHTATLLPNGKVLVAGGGNPGLLISAELWDPTFGISSGPYDAFSDFSNAGNPNGVWSYGWSEGLGSAFQLHMSSEPGFIPGADRWGTPAIDYYFMIAKNKTGSPILGATGTFSYPPNMVYMHPTLPNRYTILRWVAPRTGTFLFQGKFAGLDVVTAVADTDVHILHNSTTELLAPTVLRGVGTEKVFSFSRAVIAGDTMDFAVGRGPSGFHQNDSTGLNVTITSQSPLPGATLGPAGSSRNPSGTASEPVNTATGNYYTSQTDLAVPGKGLSFEFTRFYNSSDAYNGPLGFGWTHSFNIFLTVNNGGEVTVKEGDGGQIVFSPAGGGNYNPATAGVFDTLQKNGGGTFTLTRKNQTKLNFSAAGKLTSIVDRNGNRQTLSYNGGGLLATVTDSSGRTYTFGYDGSRRIGLVTDPIGRTLQYTYDATGNLNSVQDPLGGLTVYAYDANHRMTSATDPRGNVYLQNTYDAQGRVIRQRNARGFETTFAYDTPSAGITTITDPLGNATRHVHDASLRLIQVIDAAGGVTAYAYDAKNLKSAVTDALGRTQTFTYDASGNLLTVTDPALATTSFEYDAKNNLTKITDRLGRITRFTYDASGNLTQITDAAGGVTSFTYDGSGQVLTARNARNFTTSFQYDAAGNLTRVTDALGGRVDMTYDGVGRLLTVKNQLGKTGSRTYDANNRLVSVTDPLGNATAFQYDANGNLTRITDANGRVTQYAYDSTNKLTQVTDAIGGVTQYAYDGNTDLISVRDAKGQVTVYTYDSLRRLKTTTDPLGKQKQYNYDAAGNVTSTLDGNGKTNVFGYDALNRLVSMALSDGKNVAYAYDAVGNRLTMTDWRGTTNYAYDLLNRVLSVATPDGKTVGYQYDVVGNRTRLTYPDGKQVQFAYDALNRMVSVTDWAGKTTLYSYDLAGNLTLMTHPNRATSSYGYDAANRLLSIVNRSGARTLSSFTYTLDKVGNRLQVASSAGGMTQYGYDGLYRLTSWRPPSGQVTQYIYDAVGNRTSMSGPGGATNYTYNAADELTAAGPTTFTYDGNGNLLTKTTGGSTVTYAWDALNRLVSVVGGAMNTHYAYDGDGNRVSQTIPAGIYQYLNDTVTALPVVLHETGPDGPITYAYGLSMVSARGNGFEHYYQFDGLGSVVTITNETGALRANYLYEPWGRLLNPVDPLGARNRFKFTAESVDAEAGLLYLRARYYDPWIGRFLSRDPIGFQPRRPFAMNRYQYAHSNPVRFRDPNGLSAIESHVAGATTTIPPDINWQSGKSILIGFLWELARFAAEVAERGGGEIVTAIEAGKDLKSAAEIADSMKRTSDRVARLDHIYETGTQSQKYALDDIATGFCGGGRSWNQCSPEQKEAAVAEAEMKLGGGFSSGWALPEFARRLWGKLSGR